MTWSATEITALAAKAARGAGAPAGQAARFGAAAARHLCAGRAPEALEAALADLPAGPVLDLPRLLDAALLSGSCTPDWPGAVSYELALSYAECLPCRVVLSPGADDRPRLEVMPDEPPDAAPARRIRCAPRFIAALEELAAKTFVPETEASRAAGAGAGLTDND